MLNKILIVSVILATIALFACILWLNGQLKQIECYNMKLTELTQECREKL